MHRKCGQSVMFAVKLQHASQINRADYIYVVQKEGLVQTAGVIEKEIGGFFKPPPVSSKTSSREISILMPKLSFFQVVDDHVREVKCTLIITSRTPSVRKRESVISSSVRPATSTSAFGLSFVSGRERLPGRPPESSLSLRGSLQFTMPHYHA